MTNRDISRNRVDVHMGNVTNNGRVARLANTNVDTSSFMEEHTGKATPSATAR